MTTRTIPARVITTCDLCDSVCTRENRRHTGSVNVERAGLDMAGHAVGNDSLHYDVCDICLGLVVFTLDELRSKPKKVTPP